MHDDHVLFRSCQNSVIHDIRILHRLPLCLIFESLLLDTSDIQDVGLRKNFVKRFTLVNRDASALGGVNDALWHFERRRSDKVQTNRVEAEQNHQRVDSAAVLEISEERNGLAVDRAEFRSNGVDVQ